MLISQDWVIFLTKHWVLVGLFLLITVALLQQYWSQHRFGVQRLSPEEAVQLANHEQALLLDVRRIDAFKAGHCLGALSIESEVLSRKMDPLTQYQAKTVVVICERGVQAQQSADFLKKQGFKVAVLEGGMQQWRSSGLPVVSSK